MLVKPVTALDKIKARYPKGLHEVSCEEMSAVEKAYQGKMVSPGHLVRLFGVTRETVRQWALRGAIRYFSLKKSYVLIPLEEVKEIEDYFTKKGKIGFK